MSRRYRGRRRITRMLSGIGITVVVVSVLIVTAFLFLRDYISLTEDGLLISLPFVNTHSPAPSEPDIDEDDDSGEIQLVVEQTPTPSPTAKPTPEPSVPVSSPIKPVPGFLPQSELNKDAALLELATLCDDGSIDTVIIEVKSVTGVIATDSDLEKAIGILGENAKLVAYFSVLEDNSITRQRAAFGIKHTSGVNWLDANRSRWINPYVPEARDWLAVQLAAVDQEAFSAVLLDGLGFPTEGRLEVMVLSDEMPREEIIETLTAELIAATILPCWIIDDSNITFEGGSLGTFPAEAFGP